MKKTILVLVGLICLLVSMIFFNFIYPVIRSHSKGKDTDTPKLVYSEAYEKNLRKETIKELYGDREEYAKKRTGDRSKYIDREASKAGTLVVDETRMQQVYEQKLKEFDDMVDQDRVDSIVREKQEQLVAEQAYKDTNKNKRDEHYSREMMYWNNGGKYAAMVVDFFMILYLIFFKLRKR